MLTLRFTRALAVLLITAGLGLGKPVNCLPKPAFQAAIDATDLVEALSFQAVTDVFILTFF